MKKTVLLGLLSVTTLSISSNAMASSVSSILKKAFPESMFTPKCSSGNAKIDWNLVAQAEKNGGSAAIQQKFQDRVAPCLSGDNPNYQKKFEESCSHPSAPSNAKNRYCHAGAALMQQKKDPFGVDGQQGGGQQQQGNTFGMQQQQEQGNSFDGGETQQDGFGGQQQPVMGTPMHRQGSIQNVDGGRIEALEQQLQQLVQFMQQLAPFVQQLSVQVEQMQAQQQGGFADQQYGQQGGFGGQQYGGQQYSQQTRW